jgi:beta-glucosidase/6-phospho-beta-glucosidase/beta-galactosidase
MLKGLDPAIDYFHRYSKKVKLSPEQAVEAYRAMRC